MKASRLIAGMVLAAVTLWSSAGFAGCTKAQLSGNWVMFFSDGNYCRFRIKGNGQFDTANSACVNPDLGTAAPDSGSMDIDNGGECAASGEFSVGGVTTTVVLNFTTDRSSGGGAFYFPDTGEKGNLSMMRLH